MFVRAHCGKKFQQKFFERERNFRQKIDASNEQI